MQKEIQWLLKEKYGGELTAAAKKDIDRLRSGEPLAYVIGFIDFLGCRIDLSKKPLIPRPETEYWAGSEIEKIKPIVKSNDVAVLDIFSGSGCIGISIMRQIPRARMVFADASVAAVDQIKINVKINALTAGRCEIIQSDMFENITGTFDYMFANPPYIPTARKGRVQKSVLAYEPQDALFGGPDGLFYIEQFLSRARDFLNPGGTIYMEFDNIQKKQIDSLLKKYGYASWQFHKDQYGTWRWVSIVS
jgi:release factor glutamine methyltransferase